MSYDHRLIAATLLIASFILAACGQVASTTTKIEPAKVEAIDGTKLNRLTLTPKAAERLGIQTTPLREEQVNGVQRKVIPYAALIYGLNGDTWLYTSPAPLTFIRAPISVEFIEGNRVILTDGPAVGTEIVTVGVAQLYGTDTGIGK